MDDRKQNPKLSTEGQGRSRKAERELPIINVEPTVVELEENVRKTLPYATTGGARKPPGPKPPTAPRRKREK